MSFTDHQTREHAQASAEQQSQGRLISRSEAIQRGLKRYFTGNPCKHGHIAERNVARRSCVECSRIKAKEEYESRKEYFSKYEKYFRDKDKKREYYTSKETREKFNERDRKKYWKDPEKSRKIALKKYHKSKDKILKRKYERDAEKRVTDPDFRMMERMRSMVWRVLKFTGKKKHTRTTKLLGYSQHDLVEHLEKQFTKKMTWGNYGDYWQIDHIVPVAKMIRDGVTDPAVVNALTNLMPLEKKENLIKRDKEIYII